MSLWKCASAKYSRIPTDTCLSPTPPGSHLNLGDQGWPDPAAGLVAIRTAHRHQSLEALLSDQLSTATLIDAVAQISVIREDVYGSKDSAIGTNGKIVTYPMVKTTLFVPNARKAKPHVLLGTMITPEILPSLRSGRGTVGALRESVWRAGATPHAANVEVVWYELTRLWQLSNPYKDKLPLRLLIMKIMLQLPERLLSLCKKSEISWQL